MKSLPARPASNAPMLTWKEKRDGPPAEVAELLGKLPDAELAKRLGVNRRLIWKWRTERKIPSPPRATVAPAVLSPDQVAQLGKRSDGELAREFGFSDFQIQQVRTRLGIPRHVPDRSEMDAMLGTITDLAIGSTLGIAQPVVSKLRRDRGIPATRDALNWTAELQALLPLLSDEALAARACCGVMQIQAIRRGEQVLSNKTPLREITGLLSTWSDEDLAAQHGGTPARYASARQRRGIPVRGRAPEAQADSMR